MPLGLSYEEYHDPCRGCGVEDDDEREACFEELTLRGEAFVYAMGVGATGEAGDEDRGA
jgi:hypothetical protein